MGANPLQTTAAGHDPHDILWPTTFYSTGTTYIMLFTSVFLLTYENNWHIDNYNRCFITKHFLTLSHYTHYLPLFSMNSCICLQKQSLSCHSLSLMVFYSDA